MATTHRRAVILSMGDELTLGQALDTNARWIARRLVKRGIVPVEHVTLPDDLEAVVRGFERAAAQADVVIATGGLGPTPDDLTREALARVMGDRLVEDPASLEQIRAWFAGRGRTMLAVNAVQALRPSRARAIENKWGTAPGLVGEVNGVRCYCLPGPPSEMASMYEAAVEPDLQPFEEGRVVVRAIHTVGLGESEVATRLGDLMRRDARVLVGTTASQGVVSVRIRDESAGAAAGRDSAGQPTSTGVEIVERRVRACVAGHIAWEGEATIAQALIDQLRAAGRTLATVESCTGGLVGSMITEVAGSSDVYPGGWVTYSNQMKCSLVGVERGLIDQHGAVSEQVASAMATGGLERSGADHCVAITGIAGPGGGGQHKPVGTVYVCHAGRGGEVDCRFLRLDGGRDAVRRWSASAAMAMALYASRGERAPVLLREVRGR